MNVGMGCSDLGMRHDLRERFIGMDWFALLEFGLDISFFRMG